MTYHFNVYSVYTCLHLFFGVSVNAGRCYWLAFGRNVYSVYTIILLWDILYRYKGMQIGVYRNYKLLETYSVNVNSRSGGGFQRLHTL